MGDLISQLGLDWRLILSQLFNFILLLIVLERFVYRPILKAVDARKQQIQENDKRERSLEKKLSEMGSIKDNVLKEAEEAGEKLRAEILKQAEEAKEHILVTAREDAVRIVDAEKKAIKDEIERIEKTIQDKIGDAISVAVEKGLSDVLDDGVRTKVLERSVEEFLSAHKPGELGATYDLRETVNS